MKRKILSSDIADSHLKNPELLTINPLVFTPLLYPRPEKEPLSIVTVSTNLIE
jgi:hypothetical protein